MGVYQNVVLRAKNKNAKYKLKYTYKQDVSTNNGLTSIKYTYAKLIESLDKKKYSYEI